MNKTDLKIRFEHDQPSKVFGSSVFTVYLLIVLLGILILGILDTVLNRYYGVNGSVTTFLVSDKAGDIFQSGCSKPVIGVHYFGDFQSEYCRMNRSTPYPSNAPSLYLPGFYVLLSFFSFFTPVASSWLAVTILSVLFLVATIKAHFKGKSSIIASIILLAVFNPFWQAIDRGNISWLFGVGFIVLGAKSELRTERGWLLAVGLTLKMQLAPFLLILLLGGTIREKCRSLVHFAFIFFLLNFLIPLIEWRDFSQFYPNYFKSLRSIKPVDNGYGLRSLFHTVTQHTWTIWFWVFFFAFSIGLTMCLVLINELDRLLDRCNANEGIILSTLVSASIIILSSPLSFAYSLMAFLVPTVLIVGMKSGARLIHKVQLALVTICVLPNTISLDPFIGRQKRLPAEEFLNYPSLGNLVPSVLLPSVAFSAVIIGCIEFRRQEVMKQRARK